MKKKTKCLFISSLFAIVIGCSFFYSKLLKANPVGCIEHASSTCTSMENEWCYYFLKSTGEVCTYWNATNTDFIDEREGL